MPFDALFVFVGGGFGSVLRYAVSLCIGAAAFPWATLAVNVGSFALGIAAVAMGYLLAKN